MIDWLSVNMDNCSVPFGSTIVEGYGLYYNKIKIADIRRNTYVFSGSALRRVRELFDLNDDQIVSVLTSGRQNSVTRIDFCLDVVTEEHISPTMLMGSVRCKKARVVSHYYDNRGGDTLYVGSRKSARFVRIYDKAAEQCKQRSEENWLRIELQMRNHYARDFVRACNDHSVHATGIAAIKNLIDFADMDWWTEITTQTQNITFPTYGRKESKTMRWLETQVSKTFERRYTYSEYVTMRNMLVTWLTKLDKNHDFGEL